MRSWTGGAALGALVVAAACGGARPGQPVGGRSLEPGDHEFWLDLGGFERGYLVRVPEAARSGRALPVVVALHGGGGNARAFKASSGLDPVADREGFLALYPFGYGSRRDRFLTWNAGACCGAAHADDAGDVGFVLAVLDDLSGRTPADASRVFATGHSNGAMMAYRLAVDAGHRFAAIAPVSGAMNLGPVPGPGPSVPILHIHSLDDPRAPYDGGLGPPFPLTNARVHHEPVLEGIRFWVERNACPASPSVGPTRHGAPDSEDAEHTVTRLEWEPCATGAPVVHLRLTGAGHGWPGHRFGPVRERIVGPDTEIVDAAEEAWRFFRSVTQSR